jgi:hypothetical protein
MLKPVESRYHDMPLRYLVNPNLMADIINYTRTEAVSIQAVLQLFLYADEMNHA